MINVVSCPQFCHKSVVSDVGKDVGSFVGS